MNSRRDLLLALAVLRQGFCDTDSVLEAVTLSGLGPDTSLGDALVARGRLRPDQLQALESEIDGLLLRFPELASGGERTSEAPETVDLPDRHDGEPASTAIDDPAASRPFAGALPETAAETFGAQTAEWAASTIDAEPQANANAAEEAELLARLADPPPTRERYRLLDRIGRGGMGDVWLAFDRQFGREVALKVERDDRQSASSTARFVREAQITGQLEHPGIVTVHEVAHADDRMPFYTMRRVSKVSLAQRVGEFHKALASGLAGRVELADLLEAFTGACNAVGYAHARSVLHRDLKPQNIMLGDFGEVVVLDWGLAKPLGDPAKDPAAVRASFGENGEELTANGSIIGTPPYMPPEQARGELDRLGPATDIYSLGAVLYEILTGRRPYKGKAIEVINQVVKGPPPSPREVRPGIPRALEAICLKAMAREPEYRYGTALDLTAEVRRWLVDEPVEAYPEPLTRRVARWGRRHRSLVVGAAVLLASASVALAVSTGLIWSEQQRTRAQQLLAEQQRNRAEQNLDLVRDLSMNLITIADERLAPIRETEVIRRDMIDAALNLFKTSLAQRPDDPELQRSTAKLYRYSANVRRLLNENEVADRSYLESIRLLEALVEAEPTSWFYREQLAETLRDYAQNLNRAGRRREAVEAIDRSIGQAERLKAAYPQEARHSRTLGVALADRSAIQFRLGRFAEALKSGQDAAVLLDDLLEALPREQKSLDPLLHAMAVQGIAVAQSELGQLDQALETHAEAIRLHRALLEEASTNDRVHTYCRAILERCRTAARFEDRREKVERDLKAVILNWQNLTGQFKQIAMYRDSLAAAHRERGLVRVDLSQFGPAEEDLEASRQILEELVAEFPELPGYRANLGRTYGGLGRLARAHGDDRLAAEWLDKAVASLDLALELEPEDFIDQRSRDELRAERDALDGDDGRELGRP